LSDAPLADTRLLPPALLVSEPSLLLPLSGSDPD
jgi:hypothetical protein